MLKFHWFLVDFSSPGCVFRAPLFRLMLFRGGKRVRRFSPGSRLGLPRSELPGSHSLSSLRQTGTPLATQARSSSSASQIKCEWKAYAHARARTRCCMLFPLSRFCTTMARAEADTEISRELVLLPANTTHVWQALDRVFKQWHAAYSNAMRIWKCDNNLKVCKSCSNIFLIAVGANARRLRSRVREGLAVVDNC